MGIAYTEGYKYQLAEDYRCDTGIVGNACRTDWIELAQNGTILIRKGYAWDGPSGPTIDGASNMRGSLVHDALYQLMRNSKLDAKEWRAHADRLFRTHLREDGMNWFRAWYYWRGVVRGGASSADPSHKRKVKHAPR